MTFEYKVIPAPKKGLKARGVKGGEARFAHALETVMNELGAEGWEYQRTDTLPVEERQGLTGKTTSFQNMLVFRRPTTTAQASVPIAALIEDHSQNQDEEAATADVSKEDTADVSKDVSVDAETKTADENAGVDDETEIAPSTEPREEPRPMVLPWTKRRDNEHASDEDASDTVTQS